MRHRRADVVDRAISLLDEIGLEALSMRRLAAELGLQPSALYHHFVSRQALLGATVDEMLARGRRPTEVVTWQDELRLVCVELRDTMLRHRDGAALVSTVRALGVGGDEPIRRMTDALRWNGADEELARVGARTLFQFVYGHVADGQASPSPGASTPDADFALGLGVVLTGLEAHVETQRSERQRSERQRSVTQRAAT